MYATIATFSMGDPKKRDAQNEVLHTQIIPSVKRLPGFVSGYWTIDRETNDSYGFLVWEDEASARRLAEFIRGNGAKVQQESNDVKFLSMAVTEVVGTAER